MEPPLTDTSIQRTPPNNGQIFSSQNALWQKVTPPYSGHLSTTDDKIGPIGVRYMEVPLYAPSLFKRDDFWQEKFQAEYCSVISFEIFELFMYELIFALC